MSLLEKLVVAMAAQEVALEAVKAASIVIRMAKMTNDEAAAEPTEVRQAKADLSMINVKTASFLVKRREAEAQIVILEAAIEAKSFPEGSPGRKEILALAAKVVAR